MHHPTDKIVHTTAFVKPVVELWLEREIAQWVHDEGLIQWPIGPCAYVILYLLKYICLSPSTVRNEMKLSDRVSDHGAMGCQINPSSQCSTTGLTKATVCAIMSVGWCM